MNRTCNGQQFKVNEKWYWRCFGNGAITELKSPLENTPKCPVCGRLILSSIVEVDTRMKITQQICFKSGRFWLDFQEMILPG